MLQVGSSQYLMQCVSYSELFRVLRHEVAQFQEVMQNSSIGWRIRP
jgi:hypothetical protein